MFCLPGGLYGSATWLFLIDFLRLHWSLVFLFVELFKTTKFYCFNISYLQQDLEKVCSTFVLCWCNWNYLLLIFASYFVLLLNKVWISKKWYNLNLTNNDCLLAFFVSCFVVTKCFSLSVTAFVKVKLEENSSFI